MINQSDDISYILFLKRFLMFFSYLYTLGYSILYPNMGVGVQNIFSKGQAHTSTLCTNKRWNIPFWYI